MDKKRREILSLALPSAFIALTASARGDSSKLSRDPVDVPPVPMNKNDSVSFRKFLAEKKGTVDATQALTDAITSGMPVEIPHDYILRVESAGIPTIAGARLFGQAGTMPKIIIDHTDISRPQFILGGSNKIENLIFRYPNQKLELANGYEPIKYKPLFSGAGYYSEIRNLDIGNAYYGFMIGSKDGSASHVVIDNIIGAPIFRGLSLDCCLDVPRVSDVHFNYNYLASDGFQYGQALKQWMFDNATAFHIGKCDFATFFRLFSYGYHRGIYLRSERSLGSADNCRFISCDMDMSRHPIWFQNWQNKVSITDSKLVGNALGKNLGFSTGAPSYNVIRNSDDGLAVLDNLDMNDYASHAVVTQSNTLVSNCRFSRYGIEGNIAAGIFVNANSSLSIDNTILDGALGKKTKGIYSNTSNHSLNIGAGVEIVNQADESFYWSKGAVFLDNSTNLGGSPGLSSMSPISHVPKNYFSESMPQYGDYFMPGDSITLTKISGASEDKFGRYFVTGFKRLTPSDKSGNNHINGVDWIETKSYC